MPSGWVSGRQARSKSVNVPGLIWRIVIQTKCSSTVASSRDRRDRQPLGTNAGQPLSKDYFSSSRDTDSAQPSVPKPAPHRPHSVSTSRRDGGHNRDCQCRAGGGQAPPNAPQGPAVNCMPCARGRRWHDASSHHRRAQEWGCRGRGRVTNPSRSGDVLPLPAARQPDQ